MRKKGTASIRLPKKLLIEAARVFGRQGGKARLKRMTAEERRAVARKAAVARWARRKTKRNSNA